MGYTDAVAREVGQCKGPRGNNFACALNALVGEAGNLQGQHSGKFAPRMEDGLGSP